MIVKAICWNDNEEYEVHFFAHRTVIKAYPAETDPEAVFAVEMRPEDTRWGLTADVIEAFTPSRHTRLYLIDDELTLRSIRTLVDEGSRKGEGKS